MNDDLVLPFYLPHASVRGRLVRLGPAIDAIIKRHNAPDSVAHLLAETTAMVAALGTAMKFDGIFTIQIRGDGPVSLLVADITTQGALRAHAQYDAQALEQSKFHGSVLLGQGNLVFTVDQDNSDERYQGIVPLNGHAGLIEAFQLYFRQSEQIPTGIMVQAKHMDDGSWRAGCLLAQRMPVHDESTIRCDTAQQNDWLRIMALMHTCTERELTTTQIAPEELLYRIFHEEGVRVFEPQKLYHACRCSTQKIEDVLAALPQTELKTMVEQDGKITVLCDFCGQAYAFDKTSKLFASK
ncbi:MAG: Hsp33 family molecular chaperone HslO [Alphaproteobacteria bacterium]|nr:Hsp33 family molecular chaperone HslO [Alphaproteobacteria bacterium]